MVIIVTASLTNTDTHQLAPPHLTGGVCLLMLQHKGTLHDDFAQASSIRRFVSALSIFVISPCRVLKRTLRWEGSLGILDAITNEATAGVEWLETQKKINSRPAIDCVFTLARRAKIKSPMALMKGSVQDGNQRRKKEKRCRLWLTA